LFGVFKIYKHQIIDMWKRHLSSLLGFKSFCSLGNNTGFSPFSFKDFQLNSHLSTLANIHKIYHTLNKLVSQSFFFFFFWWDCGLNSGLRTCKAGALLLEPHLQTILLWLFLEMGSLEHFAQAGLEW
jgi:hypothetical protein